MISKDAIALRAITNELTGDRGYWCPLCEDFWFRPFFNYKGKLVWFCTGEHYSISTGMMTLNDYFATTQASEANDGPK